MGKAKTAPVIDFAAWRREQMDKGALDINMGDGVIVRLPPPELWPNAVRELVLSGAPVEEHHRAILGDAGYDQWVGAGGTTDALEWFIRNRHELTVPES